MIMSAKHAGRCRFNASLSDMSSAMTDDLGCGGDFMLFSMQTRKVESSRRASRCQCVLIGGDIHPNPIQKWMSFVFRVVHIGVDIGVESDQIETAFCVTI